MKKVMKRILNSLTLVAMVLVMALSVIAFTTINGNATDGNNINSGANINNPGNVNDPTNPDPEEPEDPTKTSSLSGIYQFGKELGFEDIYYTDLEELITYFETKDLNGVYNAVKPLGFEKFIKDFVMLNDNFRGLYFNNGVASPMVNNNGIFSFIEGEAEEDILYTINENGEIETNVPVLRLEYNEETNSLTIYVQFNYENADGENVITPLYVKTTLEFISDSNAAFEGSNYNYVESSASIVTTSHMSVDINTKLNTLATMLGINVTEDTTASELIEKGFNSCSILINEDATRIVVDFKDGSFKISSIDPESETFAWNNAKAQIVSRSLNLETNTYLVQFEITIDEETKLVFSYTANV